MQTQHALFILDETDERIRELTTMLNETGSLGMSSFLCEPETKEVIGTRKAGTSFAMDYGTFMRWFVEPLHREPVTRPWDASGATSDEKLAARILANDLNGRLTPDSGIDRYLVDQASEEVVQIDTDGTRRAIPVRGFVKLFTPRS